MTNNMFCPNPKLLLVYQFYIAKVHYPFEPMSEYLRKKLVQYPKAETGSRNMHKENLFNFLWVTFLNMKRITFYSIVFK